MIWLLVSVGVASASVAEAQGLALQAYQGCVLRRAAEFHHKELAADDPGMVAYAAGVTCDKERSDLLQKTQAFVRERDPNLGPGGVGKATALFIVKQEADLERAVEAVIIREANAPNN